MDFDAIRTLDATLILPELPIHAKLHYLLQKLTLPVIKVTLAATTVAFKCNVSYLASAILEPPSN